MRSPVMHRMVCHDNVYRTPFTTRAMSISYCVIMQNGERVQVWSPL